MTEPRILNWQGGEHAFLLRCGELRALQDNCGASPFEVSSRLFARMPKINDVLEILRLGLIGGGMDAKEAARTVATIEEQVGLGPLMLTASAVIFYSLYREGAGEAIEGEPQPGATPEA